jgi:hypothetical protein
MDVIRMVVRMQKWKASGSERKYLSAAERTKGRRKPETSKGMPGAWLNRKRPREGPI